MTRSPSRPDHPVSASRLVLYAFLAMAGFFLFTEHRAHVFGLLPYLLILACPLMHLFMHGGHGHRSEHGRHDGHGQPCGHHGRNESADQGTGKRGEPS